MSELVSIIIPAYNAEAWICEAVGSALGQSWENLDVIVVDDGSTDATAQALSGLKDHRLRVIRQENRGAAAARNRGMDEARGEFIQFLDSDDLLSWRKIQDQVEALRIAIPGAVASCAWGKFVGSPSRCVVTPEPVWKVKEPLEWVICSLTGGGMMQPGAWLVPREVIDRAGRWSEGLSLHDDGEYFTRVLLESAQNVFVVGPVVYYREVPGSLSRVRGKRAAESGLKVCQARHKHLLEVKDDLRVRRALATQYAAFDYEFGLSEPELASRARELLQELGCEPEACFGGRGYRMMMTTFGYKRATKLRNLLLRYGL